MEPFKKDRRGGRKQGVPNRITGNLKATIAALVDEQFDLIVSDFATLNPKDRIDILIKLLPYVVPKAREEAEPDGEESDFMRDLKTRYPH